MADVIAIIVEDVKPQCNMQMLLPGGRWNSHYRVFLYTLADVMARIQMDYYSNGRC